MTIAFVTDIHGNLPALEAVVGDIARRGITRVANLGDSLSGPLLPQETARYLMATGWFHLAGNHERQILEFDANGGGASDRYARMELGDDVLDWIATLKPMAQLDARIYLCHGTPRSDVEYFLEWIDDAGLRAATLAEIDERLGRVDAELVVCGHSHVPRVVRASTGQTIVNPGSVGLQAYGDLEPVPHAVENRSPDARYAIAERVDGAWSTSLVAVPYDFEPMALLAERRGRPDWAIALRTGAMSA